MTLVVAIDTATEAIALGVARVGEAGSTLLAGGFELASRQANSRVLPLLREKLEACGQRPEDVGIVVVGLRSEERRGGEECSCRWWAFH